MPVQDLVELMYTVVKKLNPIICIHKQHSFLVDVFSRLFVKSLLTIYVARGAKSDIYFQGGEEMPIVISRATGEMLKSPEIPQHQQDKLWGAIVRNYSQKHPEIFSDEDKATSNKAT